MARALDPTAIAAPGRMVLPALCLGSFITTLAFVAPAPFLPAMSDDLGVSVALLGQITTVMMVMSGALALVVGPLADRYGARRFIVAGLAATAVALFDFALAPVFAALFVASIAGAVAEATVPGLSLAIAGSRFSGPAARRALGWTVGALASAPIVGVPLLTTVGDLAGWRAAFLLAGFAATVSVVLVALWLPADTPAGNDAPRWEGILDAYRPLLHDGGMRRLYACTLTRSLCWLGLLTYYGAMLEEQYDMGTGQIGLAYMLGGSGYFAGSLAAGGPLARVPTRSLVAVGTVVMAILMAAPFPGTLPTAAAVAVIPVAAFAGAVGWVGLTALLTTETPAGAGTTMVFNSALFNLGAASGAGLGGLLLATGGFTAVALGLPVFGLAAALLAWTSRSQSTRSAAAPAD
jgi:predicted MFS family arabinose efflux permease